MHRVGKFNILFRQLCIFQHCRDLLCTSYFIGFCFFVFLILFSIPVSGDVKGPSGVIRVGIFQFEPFQYVDEDGFAKGLNPDLLQEIVKDEQWTVEFVKGSWAESLARLQSGEIDLMMSVAYSTDRSKVMDYTYESVAELWGQVFIPPGSEIRNISDLAGRRVAVMKGDISAENFKKTASTLGITCELVELPTHHDVFQAVKARSVSAGVAPQHFGLRHTEQYHLVASSIMFSPFSIFFTAKKGYNHELLSHIDAHLSEWKRVQNSFYYDSLNQWLGWRLPKSIMPIWFLAALAVVTLVAVVFSGFIFFLRRVVSRKTSALQKSEERFKLAMEANKNGLWDWDIVSGEVYYSPHYTAMLGYDSTEIPGHISSWLDLIHPDDKENAFRINQDCIENRCDDFKIEFRMQHKSGCWIWILGRGMATSRGNDSQAIRLIGTHTNITQHKELENELRLGEKKMSSIFRAAPIGIGVLAERSFKEVNDFFCKMVGYSKDELVNKKSSMLYYNDEEYANVGKKLNSGYSKYGSNSVVTRFRKKDGAVLDVLLSTQPHNLEDFSVGITFTALDLTKVKLTENKLRESEVKYRSMMESMVDPVYICSSDKRISYMNSAMIKRMGHDATGKVCHKALHGLARRCPWCRFSETGPYEKYELDIVSPLDKRSYHVSSSPMVLSDGSVQKMTVFRDTTEMKKIQSQLQQAQKMEAIGNLAGGIAHDFNNLLCPIVGMSEMLMEDFDRESMQYQNVAQILKAGKRGSELVQQILAFSRQSENKKKPNRIQTIINDVLKLCRASIPSFIEIQHKIQLDCGLVVSDSTQIHQVAMNLITNAFHAVEQNEGKVCVELKEVLIDKVEKKVGNLQAGKYVLLSVSDTGNGIMPEIANKIFDPYFTTKQTGKGTGLGLATVLGIVKDHNGDIRVSSTPGKGTIFEVFFPLMESSQEIVMTPEEMIDNMGGTESILVVDDEAPIVQMEKKILERLGYLVTERVSSIEALKAFEATPDKFDLVISDMTMPGMTGDKLAQKLLALKPDLPIIICTGFSERINEENAEKIGVKALIRKPVLKKDLVKMVRDVLDEA